ncbi:MAG TPA: hypothetical protein DCQ06_14485 [Myxococcales bacterium]|nr:hypothetical protein [Myxococcales bacterium]
MADLLSRLETKLGALQYRALQQGLRKVARVRRGHVQAGPWRVPYLTGGTGPVLLLIHGFGDRKETWLPLMARLHRKFTLVAPDLIGFGEGPSVDSQHVRPREQAQTLVDMMTKLRLGPVHIVGQSMGAMIANYIALAYPERCASLTLVAPAGPKGLAPEFRTHMMIHGNPLMVRDLSDFNRLLKLSMAKAPPYPRTLRRYLSTQWSARRQELERHFEVLDGLEEQDLRPSALPELTPRSLCVVGEHERVTHRDNTEAYQQWLHNLRVEMLPGVGHNPHHEATSRLAGLISEHARR